MIPVQTIKVRYRVTEGVLSYVVPFALYETSDVAVVWAEGEGEETALSLNQDYTVSINDERNGGTVTLVAGKVPAGATLAIVSAIPPTQEMDMSSTAEVDTDALETELDRQVQMIQQITETVDRTLKVPVTSPKTPDQVMSEILDTAARANEYAEKTEGLYNEVIAIRENTETIIIQAGNEQIERIVQEGDRQRDRAAAEADRAENAADLAQLVNYVSGARDTLTVTENLAAGSVVDLPPGLAYLVGRHHLNITYDGISLSPSFYEEIGEAGKSSTRVKFLIPLYAGQEIDFWLIPLGEAGPLLDQMRNMAEETEDKADAAAASAGAAAASASDAETRAAEAAGSAGEAARSAEAAGASAVSAGRDASDAAASASAARNQAGIATTSAEEAASSATAASGSADEATTSAEAAASSASGAASAAETATQKATAAATSATNAAASAGSAETKAAEAAQSAEEAAQKLAEMEAIVATSLPAQEGNAGKFLTTDGTNASWGDVPESVELSDSVTSASSTTAASSRAVKTAHDKATEAQTEAIRVDACLVTDLADVPAGLRTGGVIILETSAPASDTGGA